MNESDYKPTSYKSVDLIKKAISAPNQRAKHLANIELLQYHKGFMDLGSPQFARCKDTIENLRSQIE